MDTIYKRLEMIRNRRNQSKELKDDSKLNDIISTADKVVKRKEDIVEGFCHISILQKDKLDLIWKQDLMMKNG